MYPFSPFLAELLKKMGKTMTAAKEMNVQVITVDFLDDIRKEGVISQIKAKSISEWGSEVTTWRVLYANSFFSHVASRTHWPAHGEGQKLVRGHFR